MEAKITCVYDEGAKEGTSLIGAKGTSFLIEVGGKRVLFDTGLRPRYLAHNLDFLEIPVDSIDAVVVSQGHPDNCRALDGLLDQRTGTLDVYCVQGLYAGKAGMLSRSVGISEENASKAVFHDLGTWMEVVPGLSVTPIIHSDAGYGEVYAVVESSQLTVVSGRCMSGPAKVLHEVSSHYGRTVRGFVGSIFLEKAKKPVAAAYAKELNDHGCTELYLNHCTGRDGMTNLRVNLGLKGVNDFYVGYVYELK